MNIPVSQLVEKIFFSTIRLCLNYKFQNAGKKQPMNVPATVGQIRVRLLFSCLFIRKTTLKVLGDTVRNQHMAIKRSGREFYPCQNGNKTKRCQPRNCRNSQSMAPGTINIHLPAVNNKDHKDGR